VRTTGALLPLSNFAMVDFAILEADASWCRPTDQRWSSATLGSFIVNTAAILGYGAAFIGAPLLIVSFRSGNSATATLAFSLPPIGV
jgi:hypothetical protein